VEIVVGQSLIQREYLIAFEVLQAFHGYIVEVTTRGVMGHGYPFDPGYMMLYMSQELLFYGPQYFPALFMVISCYRQGY
jgi:hypothetical protein